MAWARLVQLASDAESVRDVVDDAVRRGALLAVVGPQGAAPAGAAEVFDIPDIPESSPIFTQATLEEIGIEIEARLAKLERPVVYFAGLAPLAERHAKSHVGSWIRLINRRCWERAGIVVFSAADAELASEFRTVTEPPRVESKLQHMLESLANPTRRAILSYVSVSEPASYSSILRAGIVNSSPRLSFHVQKLRWDRLLARGPGGAYVLTEEGRWAWQVLQATRFEIQRTPLLVDLGKAAMRVVKQS